MRAGIWRWLGIPFVTLFALPVFGQTNGIFADFTTSMGNFTCQLDYTNAPKTVANFVGLATGERAWLDLVTGEARTNAFYNGLTFHRVVAGFVDQSGSPNGQGTDDPGYAFVDEFSPLLTFNGPWVMAMAHHLGIPNDNGSQFFLTVEPFTSGNNVYPVFGNVISGTNVVAAINRVATDSNNKPLTNVVIQQVVIRRVGAAAAAFDINAQGLPVVTNLPLSITRNSGQVVLTFSNRLYAENRYYDSTDLSSWVANPLAIEITAPTSNIVPVPIVSTNEFFRFAQVQYASSTFAPKDLLGGTLTMAFSAGLGTLTFVFNSTGGGTYSVSSGGSGSIGYNWTQDIYRGYLYPIQLSGSGESMTCTLNFKNGTSGTFNGTLYAPSPIAVAGTFTWARP
jgi:peptidyl-prolyl cis-trans isomerase A (cyclophilin A)